MNFKVNNLCDDCQKGKLKKSSFKTINEIGTNGPLELLHLDLFGSTKVQSINHSKYVFIIVGDFSRYTWTLFLNHKSDNFDMFKIFTKRIQWFKGLKIKSIRSDHGGEFENEHFNDFCNKKGISHNFFFPYTP